MKALTTLLWALATLTSLVASRRIQGHLVASELLPEATLTPNTRVVLDGGAHVSYVRADGFFEFDSVPEGSHLIEVVSQEFMYPKIRIVVSPKSVSAFYHNDGTSWTSLGPAVNLPLEIPARMKLDPFMPRPKMSVWGIVMGNPMLLMMGGTMALFYFLPKMLDGMDPEELKKMQESRSSQPKMEMPDMSESLANWFAPAQPAPSPKKK
ncbi:hypothetical protein BC830DRAFT_1107423 [Chytriomyces sp. MP71]|nr:hypothetical protein BC830DRAFT_1107423 [Chytriomyces sp. MP71]